MPSCLCNLRDQPIRMSHDTACRSHDVKLGINTFLEIFWLVENPLKDFKSVTQKNTMFPFRGRQSTVFQVSIFVLQSMGKIIFGTHSCNKTGGHQKNCHVSRAMVLCPCLAIHPLGSEGGALCSFTLCSSECRGAWSSNASDCKMNVKFYIHLLFIYYLLCIHHCYYL